jgi:hypothetical protein
MSILNRNLTHRVDVTQITTVDFSGRITEGSTESQVECYITATRRRVLRRDSGEEIQADYEILFKGNSVIEERWILSNGVDIKGETLITTAIVENVQLFSHPRQGMKLKMIMAKQI